MKNLFFFLMIFLMLLSSCRNDENSVQKIDQILNIYIDSAGNDLLNNKIPGSYTNIQWNDVYGLTDNSPVNFANKKDVDTVNFIEYLAGAKRRGIDSVGDSKTYETKIALLLSRRINDSTTTTANDTMVIQYRSTPEVFQVSKVWYNSLLKFTKTEGEPNIVKISK